MLFERASYSCAATDSGRTVEPAIDDGSWTPPRPATERSYAAAADDGSGEAHGGRGDWDGRRRRTVRCGGDSEVAYAGPCPCGRSRDRASVAVGTSTADRTADRDWAGRMTAVGGRH